MYNNASMNFGAQQPMMMNPMMGMNMFPMGGMGNQQGMMMQMMQMMMMLLQMMQQMTGGGMGSGLGSGSASGFPQVGGGCGCSGNAMNGMNNLGFGNNSPGISSEGYGNQVFNPPPVNATNSAIANQALAWDGKSFKPGESKKCADFVSTVLRESGAANVNYYGARQFKNFGSPVGKSELQPGDIVMFKNTYNASHGDPVTHVGIYVGNGKVVDRPTANKPVRTIDITSGYWSDHYYGSRRPS